MTYEKSVKHNEQNRLSMWLAAVVVGILIVVILVACGGLVSRLHSNNRRIAELESEKVKEEQRAQDIEEYKEYTQTREYIEEVAREKLENHWGHERAEELFSVRPRHILENKALPPDLYTDRLPSAFIQRESAKEEKNGFFAKFFGK